MEEQETVETKVEKKPILEEQDINNIALGQFYSITIKGNTEKEKGFVMASNVKWLLVRSLLSDYMMDGFSLVNKKYISKIERGETEIFEEKVLRLKNIGLDVPSITLDLLNVFGDFALNKQVIEICLDREFESYVGKTKRCLAKTFYLETLRPNGEWSGDILIKNKEIRIIRFSTDYVDSLVAYSKMQTPACETNGLELHSFFIEKRKRAEEGVVIRDGSGWVLVKSLFSNYMWSGFSLINKEFISTITRSDKEIFKENVLKASGKWHDFDSLSAELNTVDLINFFMNKQIVIQLSLKDNSACYIGKVTQCLNKSFYLTFLSPEGEWTDRLLFRYASLRVISFNTDYINSLLLLQNCE